MDDPWDDNADNTAVQDVEWSRLSSNFTNVRKPRCHKYCLRKILIISKVGYREGITAGKEAASQEGFDDGFAYVGVPIGREIGVLRGVSSAVLAFLKGGLPGQESLVSEAEEIASQLARFRFSDVMPRDLEAEEHARQHMEAEGIPLGVNEEIAEKRDLEGIEDMLANLTAGNGKSKGDVARPTIEDLRALKERLTRLNEQLGIAIQLD